MNVIARLAIKAGGKGGKRILGVLEADPGNPLSIDTADVITHIGKGIFHIAKEVIF